jgi:hypothetical protein
VSSLMRRANPKSATFTTWFSLTRQFRAARSLKKLIVKFTIFFFKETKITTERFTDLGKLNLVMVEWF